MSDTLLIPQLDVSMYASQFFWLGLCLVVLYVFLSRFYVPRIRTILSKRSSYIKKNREEAEAADALASTLGQEQEARMACARSDAAIVMHQGIIDAQNKESAGRALADERSAAVVEEAINKAAAIFEKQRQSIMNWSATMACDMYHKVVGVAPDIDKELLMHLVNDVYREFENGGRNNNTE